MNLDGSLSAGEVERIAVEAYIYLYPLVLMETTRRVSTNWRQDERPGVGPMGALVHARAFPGANAKTVVRPNFDTLYSHAWLDLEAEPYLVSLPAIEDRFFMCPVYDMWSDVFAAPGTRTTGRGAFAFALCTPQWRGELPAGVERIDAPTSVVWIIARTETRNVADYGYVHSLQDQMRLAPLSTWPVVPTIESVNDDGLDMRTPPMLQVRRMGPAEFLATAARLLERNRPHASDWSMLARLRRIGLVAGEPFDLERQPSVVVDAFARASEGAWREMRARGDASGASATGWTGAGDTGVYGNAYLRRMATAMFGLGAVAPEEAIYPNLQVDAEGAALHGAHRYLLRFEAGEAPPADAFWSLTVYDRQGYQVANEIDRFALGDRDELVSGADGSLEVLLAHERPADEWLANWLPVPSDDFVVTMRLYLPREPAVTQRWVAPAARRLD